MKTIIKKKMTDAVKSAKLKQDGIALRIFLQFVLLFVEIISKKVQKNVILVFRMKKKNAVMIARTIWL